MSDLTEPPKKKRRSKWGIKPAEDVGASPAPTPQGTKGAEAAAAKINAMLAAQGKLAKCDPPPYKAVLPPAHTQSAASLYSSPGPSASGLLSTPSPFLKNVTTTTAPGSNTHSGSHYVQDKVYIGMAKAPSTFNVKEKLEGPAGSYLSHIASQTHAKVFLRGKGSGYLEPTSKKESYEALHIYISHSNQAGLESARKLCESLIQTVQTECDNFVTSQQTQQPLGFGGTAYIPPAPYVNPYQHPYPPYHPQGPPYGPPQGPPQGPPHGPPQGPPQGPPHGPPHGPPQGPPQGPLHGPPHGPPQGPPHGLPQGPPHGPPHPQGPPHGPPPQGPPHGPPHGPPQGPHMYNQYQGPPQGSPMYGAGGHYLPPHPLPHSHPSNFPPPPPPPAPYSNPGVPHPQAPYYASPVPPQGPPLQGPPPQAPPPHQAPPMPEAPQPLPPMGPVKPCEAYPDFQRHDREPPKRKFTEGIPVTAETEELTDATHFSLKNTGKDDSSPHNGSGRNSAGSHKASGEPTSDQPLKETAARSFREGSSSIEKGDSHRSTQEEKEEDVPVVNGKVGKMDKTVEADLAKWKTLTVSSVRKDDHVLKRDQDSEEQAEFKVPTLPPREIAKLKSPHLPGRALIKKRSTPPLKSNTLIPADVRPPAVAKPTGPASGAVVPATAGAVGVEKPKKTISLVSYTSADSDSESDVDV